MSGAELHELGVAEIGRALRERRFSSAELTQHLLTRLSTYARLGAVLASDAKAALSQAGAADAVLARGEAGPLTGVPLAHKDIFVTDHARTGLASTAGSRMLDQYAQPRFSIGACSVVEHVRLPLVLRPERTPTADPHRRIL